MAKTVFWSWQSDLDGRVTREVIRYALDQAITILAADLEEADRPSLTSDTQGVAGTPDIVATILRKIDEAAVFVGDVTPIAVSDSGKACANPNVLLEMGYANKALSEHRVIQVWNSAFEGATLDKLPFDMRGRRGPLEFNLAVGADTPTLRSSRDKLAKALAEALKLALDTLPPPPAEAVHWQPPFSGGTDVWFDPAAEQTVTHPSHGSSRIRWKVEPHGFARLIPSKWQAKPGARRAIAEHPGHPALIGNARSLGYGISRGGATIYRPDSAEEGVYPVGALTQWFEKTGEFWGIANEFLFTPKNGRRTVATGYIFHQWVSFLERNAGLALAHGGSLPMHVRLGITGLDGTWWPAGPYDFGDEGFQSVEASFEYDGVLISVDDAAIKQLVAAAFNALAEVYGIEPHSLEAIEALAR
ncbi:hypothetical protein [Sphingobium chungangianum]